MFKQVIDFFIFYPYNIFIETGLNLWCKKGQRSRTGALLARSLVREGQEGRTGALPDRSLAQERLKWLYWRLLARSLAREGQEGRTGAFPDRSLVREGQEGRTGAFPVKFDHAKIPAAARQML